MDKKKWLLIIGFVLIMFMTGLIHLKTMEDSYERITDLSTIYDFSKVRETTQVAQEDLTTEGGKNLMDLKYFHLVLDYVDQDQFIDLKGAISESLKTGNFDAMPEAYDGITCDGVLDKSYAVTEVMTIHNMLIIELENKYLVTRYKYLFDEKRLFKELKEVKTLE